MATQNLPTTPQSAPPNFYAQAGQMAAANPGAGAAGGAGAGGASAPKDADHQFLDMTTKLLSVLQKMQDMKPRGVDVSKELQAAADAVKQAVSTVFGKDGMAGADGADQTVAGSAGASDGSAGARGGGAADTGATS